MCNPLSRQQSFTLASGKQISKRKTPGQHLTFLQFGRPIGSSYALLIDILPFNAPGVRRPHRLAACYTFGAPRVGDQGLIDRFKTPIYRIVNGPDPVTLMQPSGFALDTIKAIIRVLGIALPLWGWASFVNK